MSAIVHAAALAPAALATCCLVADRGRRRGAELAASVVMLVAMIDVIAGSVLPAVAWTAVLLVTGMLLGIAGGRRGAGRTADRGVRVHAALGCVVMAGMVVLMTGGAVGDAVAAEAAAGEHHGGSSTAFTMVVAACALGYAAASFTTAARGRGRDRWQLRTQHLGMGAATLVMGAATLI